MSHDWSLLLVRTSSWLFLSGCCVLLLTRWRPLINLGRCAPHVRGKPRRLGNVAPTRDDDANRFILLRLRLVLHYRCIEKDRREKPPERSGAHCPMAAKVPESSSM